MPDSPLLLWRRHLLPVDWQEVFGFSGPLELEVGFGDGRYTVYRALREPETRFVGLEISGASVLRAMQRVKDAKVGNVRIIKARAQFAVQHLFAPRSLEGITVNFPDPWPKKRHVENRLLQASFFRLAASRLEPGGAVRLATDHPDYLAFAREEAQKSELYDLEEAAPPEAVFETKYALKWKAQGKPLYYQVFRVLRPPAEDYPVLEEETMPHAILEGALPPRLDFAKHVQEVKSGHVILLELSRSLGPGEFHERLLFRATVDEPNLQQQVLVSVRPKGGEVVVTLEPFGDPVLTKTIKGAVGVVVGWLESHAGLKLKQASY